MSTRSRSTMAHPGKAAKAGNVASAAQSTPAAPATGKPPPARPAGHARRGGPARADAAPGLRHRNLALLLLQAREGVMARFRPILNAHGVTEQQWRILRALLEQGAMEPRQIGQVCRISSPSLAGVLARMDDLGLVQRERLAQDQRRVMVHLTDRSRALAAAMAPEIEAAYAGIEAHIGAAFIDRFYASLDELIGLLGSLPMDEDD